MPATPGPVFFPQERFFIRYLVTPGKLPLIVRSGKVGVELKLTGEPQVWALDYTGARKKRIPAEKTALGIRFHADSVTDKDAGYAFEIVREQQ